MVPTGPDSPIRGSRQATKPASPFDNCRPPSAKLRAGADHILDRHTLRPQKLVAPGLPGNVRHGVVPGRYCSHDVHTAIGLAPFEQDQGNGYWHTQHRGKLDGREQFGVEMAQPSGMRTADSGGGGASARPHEYGRLSAG